MAFFVRIVLVRPRNPLNIGAAARAMANFGFSDLAVLKPYAPVWRETVSAVGAERLVLDAKAVYSLPEAVGDCQWVIGATTGKNRRLKRPLLRLPELPAFLQKKKNPRIALLFGSEKTGLTNAYLERCHLLLTIPTGPACPSMNLSHAVAACCYELSRGKKGFGPRVKQDQDPRATAADIEQLVRHAAELFDATGYLNFLPAKERVKKIREKLLQWNVRRTDAAIIHGLFRWTLKQLKKTGGCCI